MSFRSKMNKMIYLLPEELKQVAITKLQRWRTGDKSRNVSNDTIAFDNRCNVDCEGFTLYKSYGLFEGGRIGWDSEGNITQACIETTDPNRISELIDLFPESYKEDLYAQIDRVKNGGLPIGQNIEEADGRWLMKMGRGIGADATVSFTKNGKIVMARLVRMIFHNHIPDEEFIDFNYCMRY